jgi:flagellar biogenesis protein FliO
MIGELWNTFVLLIPVFFLLTLIFGAGFIVGRLTSDRIRKREQ